MTKRDKDSESKSSMSVVVTKIVCTARSSSQTFNGKLLSLPKTKPLVS